MTFIFKLSQFIGHLNCQNRFSVLAIWNNITYGHHQTRLSWKQKKTLENTTLYDKRMHCLIQIESFGGMRQLSGQSLYNRAMLNWNIFKSGIYMVLSFFNPQWLWFVLCFVQLLNFVRAFVLCQTLYHRSPCNIIRT